MRFDTETNQLSWNISSNGLSGQAIAAHFHGPAGFGQEAGVQVNIGTISGLQTPLVGSAALTDAQESDLLNGLLYINIHTGLNPSGEIRGQVIVQQTNTISVPTLSQWGLISMMIVLTLLTLLQRRHHQKVHF